MWIVRRRALFSLILEHLAKQAQLSFPAGQPANPSWYDFSQPLVQVNAADRSPVKVLV
jgi:hypothetical protein